MLLAAVLWCTAAERGDCKAQVDFGLLLDRGECVQRDSVRARTLWTSAVPRLCRAAGNKDAVCQLRVADLFLQGTALLPRSLKAAPEHAHQAATQGHALAECWLGGRFERGEGVPIDLEKAFGWYNSAAARGLPSAFRHVGTCYLTGRGVKADVELARMWLDRAMLGGDRLANSLVKNLRLNPHSPPASG